LALPDAPLKLRRACRILGPFRICATVEHVEFKEEAMRKVLLLVLVSLFLGTACNKSEESAPAAPDASASAAAPADASSPAAMASPAAEASPAAAASPASP